MDRPLTITVIALLGLASSLPYDTPEDCSWSPYSDNGGFLTCRLSSINSRYERTNFSVIPSENTLGLKVVCSDSTTVGRLEPEGFSSLGLLEELVIEDCAIESLPARAFSGLNNLKRLEVKRANSPVLIIHPGALSELPSLEVLDLSQNNVRQLPEGELCQLQNLLHLNVSHNEVGSAFDLGLGPLTKACLSNLQILDISSNELTSLEPHSLPTWPSIVELRIQGNFIRFIGSNVFGNSSVKILDMSNNQISHLPNSLLNKLQLEAISLANNSLSSLPVDSFLGQTDLEILNLSGNHLVSLPSTITTDLVNLMELDMSNNKLEVLESELFSSLRNLQSLNLNNNKINSFQLSQTMVNLQELNLSGNKLVKIEAHDLSGLRSLSHLDLANNQIQTVHAAVFKNTSQILVLDLSDNKLTEVPDSLKYLTQLQTLDLGNNFVSDISDSSFLAMDHLWRLQLNGNLLDNVTHDILSKLVGLQIIDMSRNKIASVEKGAFDQNKLLRAIRLDGNKLEEMDGIFTHLPELKYLNVSDNKIQHFDYSIVPRTLEWLDVSHNVIAELGNYFDLSGDMGLGHLDASFNELTNVSPLNLPDNVHTLLLNDNKINKIAPYTFFKKTKLAQVDLSVNEISVVTQTALRLSSEVVELPHFLLGGNPIICDCEMEWFKTINNNNNIHRFPHISDLESIYCRLVYTTQQTFIPLVDARNDQFLCSYQTHCFSLCQCCQFDSCDCEMTCPDGCSCFHDNSWTKNIVQCSSGNFKGLPDSMPMDATEIFLDGNKIETLKSHTFIGRKNLRILHLNNSNIEKIENQTFNGLKSLTVLHLEDNNIRSLKGFEFSGLSHLRELYLQGNMITSIHNATFKALRSLEVLFLQGNTIIDFPVWQLAFNPYLVSIRLAENLWSCDCDYTHRFRGWLRVFSSKVSDLKEVSCISNEATGLNIKMADYDISPCDINTNAVSETHVQEKVVEDYMPLMIAVLASFALVVLISLVMFVYRHSIKVWIHSKYGVRVLNNNDITNVEAGKLFDAYVSYSPGDDLFVRQVLSPELELNNQYRACLHHRDLPSNTVMSDTVVRATDAAHRTIVVLSNNFIKTEWSRFDYKSGLHQALSSANKKVVFVILGEIEGHLLDPDLRLFLKTNIVLQWGDSLFWQKLKYSLPDHQKAQPQAANIHTYRTQSLNKNFNRNVALHI